MNERIMLLTKRYYVTQNSESTTVHYRVCRMKDNCILFTADAIEDALEYLTSRGVRLLSA